MVGTSTDAERLDPASPVRRVKVQQSHHEDTSCSPSMVRVLGLLTYGKQSSPAVF